MRKCIRTKTDGEAVLPAPDKMQFTASWVSSLNDAGLLEVTVSKVLQLPLDVLSRYAKFRFRQYIRTP